MLTEMRWLLTQPQSTKLLVALSILAVVVLFGALTRAWRLTNCQAVAAVAASNASRCLLILFICSSALLLLTTPAKERLNSKSLPQKACCAEAPKMVSQAPVIPIGVFTAPGLRASLLNASADKNKGIPTINFEALNQSRSTITNLEVILLDFASDGNLAIVEGTTLKADLEARERQVLTFLAKFPHEATHSLVLAIKGLTDSSNTQSIPGKNLIAALIELKTTGRQSSLQIDEQSVGQLQVEPDFCYVTFRLAHEIRVARKDAQLSVFGSYCDQHKQTFAFSFARSGSPL